MPIPKPNPDEDKDAFISRCMADSVMQAEYDNAQRLAVCEAQWDEQREGKAHPRI